MRPLQKSGFAARFWQGLKFKVQSFYGIWPQSDHEADEELDEEEKGSNLLEGALMSRLDVSLVTFYHFCSAILAHRHPKHRRKIVATLRRMSLDTMGNCYLCWMQIMSIIRCNKRYTSALGNMSEGEERKGENGPSDVPPDSWRFAWRVLYDTMEERIGRPVSDRLETCWDTPLARLQTGASWHGRLDVTTVWRERLGTISAVRRR